MKRTCIYSAACLMAACALGGESSAGIATPGGVRITPERVYVTAKSAEGADAPQREDSAFLFAHGNAALRLRLANTNDAPQKVRVQVPLKIGLRSISLIAAKEVNGGETADFDIPVPIVGQLSLRSPMDYEATAHIVDKAGETNDASIVSFGYDAAYGAAMLYNPSGRNVADDALSADRPMQLHIAASPATARFDLGDAWKKFEGSRQQTVSSRGFEGAVFESPDFTRFRRWQDLSVYDALVIDEDDWGRYPPSLKAILPDWVAGGGTLALIGTETPPIEPGNYGLGRVVFMGASSPDFDSLFKALAATMIRYSLATSPFECDIKASDAVAALRNETPFSTILIVLLVFCILAGPVLVVTLAKRNRRISLLWVFPAMAVAFSLGVMGVIVCLKGIDPELRQFVHTIYDEKAGKVVTICNHVILAPFTLQGAIRLDAKDSVVSYMSGDVKRCGDTIIYAGGEFVFRDGWAPTLWPVVFRTVSVRPIADAPASPPIPVSGRLQEHYVSATEERRGAK